jgi:hypothetical protein
MLLPPLEEQAQDTEGLAPNVPGRVIQPGVDRGAQLGLGGVAREALEGNVQRGRVGTERGFRQAPVTGKVLKPLSAGGIEIQSSHKAILHDPPARKGFSVRLRSVSLP